MQVKRPPVVQQVNDVLLGEQKIYVRAARGVRPNNFKHHPQKKYE
jgi:hypothetical protein